MLKIALGNINIKNGDVLPFDATQIKPTIHVSNVPSKYYSIIVVDPDAPSRSNPKYKYVLHWLIINNSQEIVPYQFPTPPPNSGKHRYSFYLLRQDKKIDSDTLDLKKIDGKFVRTNFNFSEFMADNNLEIIDLVIFETER